MKPVILAAVVLALSAPAALAADTPKQVAGDTAGVPEAVKTYVQANVGDPIVYLGGIKIGESVRELNAGDIWRPIPDYPQYRWCNLGGQLVVIDNRTQKVAAIF